MINEHSRVSDENLNKVEAFFVRKTKETGSTRIEATVVEIADGSGVALATAHKAIKELEKSSIIQVIKPKSRRFAITYIYEREIKDFDVEQSQQAQLDYLKDAVEKYKLESEELKRQITELQLVNMNLTNSKAR